MAGKLASEIKELKNGNMKNFNSVKIYSSKSILSYQNGSPSDTEAGDCDVMESALEKMPEKKRLSNSPCCNHENLSSECLSLLRKKLISDLSLQVFCTDLENKIIKMEPMEINKERLAIIQKLLVQISQLSNAEKLLLYLKLQNTTSNRADPLRQPLNPLGNRQEIQQTIVWIKTHLEEDRDISIPKQDVYDQYLKYCENVSMKPLSTADFGKVMKQVYPGVRPRRLGTRGNSRYCYSGMRNTLKLPVPSLPRLVAEGILSNSNVGNGSDHIAQENERSKKIEKSKRKWKTSAGRNHRISSMSHLSKSITKDMVLKCPKRSRVEIPVKSNLIVSNKVSVTNQCQLKTESAKIEEEIRNEEDSINALSKILVNDLGLCFENECSSLENNEIKERDGLSFFNKIVLETGEMKQQLDEMSNVNGNESKEITPNVKVEGVSLESDLKIFEKSIEVCDGKETKKTVSGIMGERDELKSNKMKVRKPNAFLKSQRNFTKTYVPIQPKPVSKPKAKVHFELDRSALIEFGKNSGKKDTEDSCCEESDSQEPEEEIVRYFRHLEENQFLSVFGKVNSSIHIKNNPQKILKPDEGRSQSCFEDQSRLLKPSEPIRKYNLLQRSQSSMEFSEEQPEKLEHRVKCTTSDTEKISHLRLLLEKSITAEKCVSELKTVCSPMSECNPCLVNAPCSTTPVDRKFLKLDNRKVLQSPNISCGYFNFTPISPGSQSPLKTPPSPFVSPRDTPIQRSRQNSFQNDHFFPPSKSADIGEVVLHGGDYGNKKGQIFNKRIESHKSDRYLKEFICDSNFPEFQKSLLSARPRSNSSTNFYRAKAKRSLSKVLSCDRMSFKEPNQFCEMFQHVTGNTGFSYPFMNQNAIMSDSLSSEIRQLLESDSKIQEAQCATSRSQSVPLNRMKSEGSWFSHQPSPIYNHYMNGENCEKRTPQNPRDYIGFESKNLDSFIPNEQMSLDGVSEVFTREDHDINYQIFDGNFDSGNSENNTDSDFSQNNSFVAEACFPNKIDLTVNPFPSNFSNEADSMKPYIPNFETSIDKESSSEEKGNLKLFNNSMYVDDGDSTKDPVITSFKPVFMGEFSSCPNSPVLGFFGQKGNDENQLIDFLGLDG